MDNLSLAYMTRALALTVGGGVCRAQDARKENSDSRLFYVDNYIHRHIVLP